MRSATKDGLLPAGEELHHPAVGHRSEPDDGEPADPDPDQEQLVVGREGAHCPEDDIEEGHQ